jgi:hypothetical protein
MAEPMRGVVAITPQPGASAVAAALVADWPTLSVRAVHAPFEGLVGRLADPGPLTFFTDPEFDRNAQAIFRLHDGLAAFSARFPGAVFAFVHVRGESPRLVEGIVVSEGRVLERFEPDDPGDDAMARLLARLGLPVAAGADLGWMLDA